MGKLDGKVAVITGGNSGMGLATAQRFVNEGAYVFITGRRQAELDKAVTLIGKNVTAVKGDVANLADLDRLYATVKEQKGKVDVLFANAGTGENAALGSITEEHFDKIFAINVRGLVFSVQKALPLFKDGGSIILNASIASIKGMPAFSVYSASKAAVRSFAGLDKRSQGSQDPHQHAQPRADRHPDSEQPGCDGGRTRTGQGVPCRSSADGCMGTADEIAKVALFLASDDSSFITGVELFVDGGMAQV